jgi:hypothetical protein
LPIKTWIDKDKKRIHSIVSGVVSLEEMLNTITTTVNHPDFKPGFNVLSDHTQIKKTITTKQVQALSSHIQKLKPYLADTRWAVLTAKKSSYGMMRMLSVYLESIPVELEVFYNLEEAEAWLNQKH